MPESEPAFLAGELVARDLLGEIVISNELIEDGGKVVYAHYVCHSCGAWRDRWCAKVDAGTGRAGTA